MKSKIIILLLILSINGFTQWSSDPYENLRITNFGDDPIAAISDGKGGAFFSVGISFPNDGPPSFVKYPYLLWIDKYGKHNLDTIDRLGGKGEMVWDTELFEDGTGGYFAIFIDRIFKYQYQTAYLYNDKIIVQKFDSLGNKLWGDGVYVTLDTTDNVEYEYALDKNGGCYISWWAYDEWGYYSGRQVVQHISNAGERLWSDTGKVLCLDPFYTGSEPSKIVPDNKNGIYIKYSPDNQHYYYAQIDYDGNMLWQLPCRITSAYQDDSKIAADDEGNLFCIGFSTPEWSLITYLQFESISLDGNYSSELKTLTESDAIKTYLWNFIVQDSLLVFTWTEDNSTNETNYINYFQIADKNGILKLNEKGVTPFSSKYRLNKKIIHSKDAFILTCMNEAQKINTEGELLWGNTPIIFTRREINELNDMITDGNGGFIELWLEGLNGVWGQQVNSNGELGKVTSIFENNSIELEDYYLFQNYPNPFNPSTTIKYSLPSAAHVKITVYNVVGQKVDELINKYVNAGYHNVIWNAGNYASGIYIYSIEAISLTGGKNFNSVRKMVLVK